MARKKSTGEIALLKRRVEELAVLDALISETEQLCSALESALKEFPGHGCVKYPLWRVHRKGSGDTPPEVAAANWRARLRKRNQSLREFYDWLPTEEARRIANYGSVQWGVDWEGAHEATWYVGVLKKEIGYLEREKRERVDMLPPEQLMGMQLRQARDRKGHTQQDVADTFCCEVSTISRYEAGEMKAYKYRRKIEDYIQN